MSLFGVHLSSVNIGKAAGLSLTMVDPMVISGFYPVKTLFATPGVDHEIANIKKSGKVDFVHLSAKNIISFTCKSVTST